MDAVISKIKYKTRIVFSLVLLLGFIFSSYVYYSTDAVSRSTTELVDKQIPRYLVMQQLTASLIEQERLLYEYYASDDPRLYTISFLEQCSASTKLIERLAMYFPQTPAIMSLSNIQEQLYEHALALHENMASPRTDWDLARETLSEIAKLRNQAKPLVDDLYTLVSEQVDSAKADNKQQLANSLLVVFIYSISIVILTFFMAKTSQAYLMASAKSRRLALFTTANPNPILSLNESLDIVYSNPASHILLKRLKREDSQLSDILPPELSILTKRLRNHEKHFDKVEYDIEPLHLSAEVHWLEHENAFDLHIRDITGEKRAKQKLSFQAYHDQTTKLANSYKQLEFISELISAEQKFSLSLIEVRDFSRLVSSQGVDCSTATIKALARRLTQFIEQQTDHKVHLFHLAEHTFSIITCYEQEKEALQSFYQALAKHVEQPLETKFGDLLVELDFGLSCFPIHGKDKNTLVKHARSALDSAIKNPHSSFVIYCDDLGAQLDRQMYLTKALKHAIAEQSLALHFQPQLDIQRNRIIGMETLIRWQHQDEWISPVEFIPIAEQSGLIIPLGEWILHQACQLTQRWHQQGYSDLVVAVNISPRQFKHPQFIEQVKQTLVSTGLDAKHLELEITEGVILGNERDTIEELNKLRALGVMLSIDDFGTGYSSLSYLSQFPIDKLKIDQAFIKTMHHSETERAIVNTIVELGNNLSLTLIAEGVELIEHKQYLKNIGCHEIQGYWFAKPMPAQQFIDFVAEFSATEVGELGS
ncbi:GGDEF domain-containing protein [Catenovulum sp. SM1970]|uniref:putative bifunctional diguanylate cyclase/phosphodiesterase n=1 Tax=Marinifaba aquimaris TaxID=2741323 RepID=UPI00157172AF|nr:bifunctional diguanylate cyclase/phosphodiesterase [Marinifaba aquimaris]NTS77237.1 GGDEF domain-containing protein [Marinifaba aquimaris]